MNRCSFRTSMPMIFGCASIALSLPVAPSMATESDFLADPTVQTFLNSPAPLSLYGVTLYGTLDVGVANQSHAANYSADFPQSVDYAMSSNSKNLTGSKTFLASSIMGQSKVGLKGAEELADGINLVFRLETTFNPVSGTLANGQKSLLDNAGQAYKAGTQAAGDSARDGQVFNAAAYGGLNNERFGTLTFGTHPTTLRDSFAAYDPQDLAYGFSLIGFSSTYSGGGDTEDSRLDKSLKYNLAYGPLRFGALYQLPGNTNSTGGDSALQVDLGVDDGPLSLDVAFAQKKDAVNISNPPSAAVGPTSNQLVPTISDNNALAAFAKYDWKPVTFYGAYEHIAYFNPSRSLTLSTESSPSLGGYEYSSITDNAYATAKILHLLWFGTRYQATSELSLRLAYYLLLQDNYSGVDQSVCMRNNGSATSSGYGGVHTNSSACAGSEQAASIAADYRLNKRFDLYAGLMFSRVDQGLYVGSSDLHNNTLASSAGIRFKF